MPEAVYTRATPEMAAFLMFWFSRCGDRASLVELMKTRWPGIVLDDYRVSQTWRHQNEQCVPPKLQVDLNIYPGRVDQCIRKKYLQSKDPAWMTRIMNLTEAEDQVLDDLDVKEDILGYSRRTWMLDELLPKLDPQRKSKPIKGQSGELRNRREDAEAFLMFWLSRGISLDGISAILENKFQITLDKEQFIKLKNNTITKATSKGFPVCNQSQSVFSPFQSDSFIQGLMGSRTQWIKEVKILQGYELQVMGNEIDSEAIMNNAETPWSEHEGWSIQSKRRITIPVRKDSSQQRTTRLRVSSYE